MYAVVFSEDAKKDLKELHKKAPLAVSKLSKLLVELKEHPRTGTGQVEILKGYDGTVYSRRITQEHRLVYKIYENDLTVLVLSAFGHY
ncbi:MAG: Txe/YoeB family addiction module toxin [Bacteroidales bacterium]|nr:Txe/YoeB family addiction module toxin [Bacteroidales bacterium]